MSRAPVWCLRVPMGLCQLHPPTLIQSQATGEGFIMVCVGGCAAGLLTLGQQAERVYTRTCVCMLNVHFRDGPSLDLHWALTHHLLENFFKALVPSTSPSPL